MTNCYFKQCSNPVESKEHLPAECFFITVNKNNLIKVPSCKQHNELKHLDDEYARNIISLQAACNQHGFETADKKTLKSLKNSPGLLTSLMKTVRPIENSYHFAAEFDSRRIYNWISALAYGIYRHDFQLNYKDDWSIFDESSAIIIRDNNFDAFNFEANILSQLRTLQFDIIETSHPDIFQYFRFTESNRTTYKFVFYGAIVFYAYPK